MSCFFLYLTYSPAILAVTILLFVSCQCLQVEVNVRNRLNPSRKKIKVICAPALKNVKRSQNAVLGASLNLGHHRRNRIVPTFRHEVQIPKVMMNSSSRLKCFVPSPHFQFTKLPKKRLHRELSDINSTASVSVENGNCPPGYRRDQERCFPCFPGSYTSGQETECFLCPKDFYIDKAAADSCWPCPEGKITLAEGADSVEACISPDSSGNISSSLSTIWLVILIFIIIFLIFSWLFIIFLLIRLYYKRNGNFIKEKQASEINHEEQKKKSRLSTNKNHVKNNRIIKDVADEKLEKIGEENVSPSDLEHREIQKGSNRPKLSKNTITIKSPATNNYFYINQDKDSISIETDLLDTGIHSSNHEKKNRDLSSIPSSVSVCSDESKPRDEKESQTHVKSLFSDSFVAHKMIPETEYLKTWKDRNGTETQEDELLFPSTHNEKFVVGDQPEETKQSESNNQTDTQILANQQCEDEYQITENLTRLNEAGPSVENMTFDDNHKVPVIPQAISSNEGNAIENNPTKNQNLNHEEFQNENILINKPSTKKSWSLNSFPKLYTPLFQGSILLDVDGRQQSDCKPDNDGDDKTTQFGSSMVDSSKTPEEIRITIEPDVKSYHSDHKSAKESQTSLATLNHSDSELYECPLHGDSRLLSFKPYHVDLCVEFVT